MNEQCPREGREMDMLGLGSRPLHEGELQSPGHLVISLPRCSGIQPERCLAEGPAISDDTLLHLLGKDFGDH